MGYRLNRLDESVLMAVPKPMQTEFGIHYRLQSCGKSLTIEYEIHWKVIFSDWKKKCPKIAQFARVLKFVQMFSFSVSLLSKVSRLTRQYGISYLQIRFPSYLSFVP